MKQFMLFALLAVILLPWAMAVEKVDLRESPQVLILMAQARNVSDNHADMLRNALGMSQDNTLQLLRRMGDRGLTYSRYQLVYRGVPVWGEHIIVTEDGNRNVVRLHGNAITGLEKELLSVEPAFSAAEALSLMKAKHVAKTGVREGLVYENEASSLVVYVADRKAVLSYAVSFFSDLANGGKPARPYYIVDANTKDVIFEYEGLTTDEATGPGGNAKTGRYEYGKEYPKLDVAFANNTSTMNTTNVKTVNLNHGSSGSTAYSFTGTVNTVKEINGAYSPLNDAHFFGGVVFGLYKDWYGTAPLTFQLVLKVHYSNSYENAFWNGSSMTFGDGKTRFYPLISLDVVTHEVSHGFTEQNSGLVYSAQSGGINEAFSDIAGEAAEYFMQKKNDWMVGADIFKSTGALRYLNDPPKDGKSIGSAKNYTNGMDVHYSSGVFNKAFYLLAVTPSWNTKKAFDVFIKANQSFWTPSATFVTGGKGCVDAAKDLGYKTEDVVAAFQGVDVVISGR